MRRVPGLLREHGWCVAWPNRNVLRGRPEVAEQCTVYRCDHAEAVVPSYWKACLPRFFHTVPYGSPAISKATKQGIPPSSSASTSPFAPSRSFLDTDRGFFAIGGAERAR